MKILGGWAWAIAGVAALAQSTAPSLPNPSGGWQVGRTAYDWTDEARRETLSQDGNARRELMVYVWYPARAASKGRPSAEYFRGAKKIDRAPGTQAIRGDFGSIWPLIVSGAITSPVWEDAPVARTKERFPVILFSHGLGGSSFEYTSFLEELVSHGYVIAAVEHTYEANAVAFPDGRVIPVSPQESRGIADFPGASPEERMQNALAWGEERTDVHAADLRFVLDRLFQLDRSRERDFPLAGHLDLDRVAAVGHSAGGCAAVRACQLDQRIKACVSEDGGGYPFGAFLNYHGAECPKQPFLFVEAYRPPMRMDPAKWNEFLSRMDRQLKSCAGGSYHVILKSAGMMHGSFSDEPLLNAGSDATARETALHHLRLAEVVTLDFLNKYLKGEAARVIDGGPAGEREIAITRNGR